MAIGFQVDLANNVEAYQELPADERAALVRVQAEAAQLEAAQAAKTRQREQDLALIRARAQQDPAFAALARLLEG